MIYAYTVPALLLAFVVDAVIGDPYRFPHPVRLFGRAIDKGTDRLLKPGLSADALIRRGALLSVCVVLAAWIVPAVLLVLCAGLNVWLWFCLEVAFCWTVLAAKTLRRESMKVYRALRDGNMDLARKQLSNIVGRDTHDLDANSIAKAAVESVAENTSDGVTAPVFYAAIGGAPLGLAYKAVNTLDSMIGYKNDKFLYYGRVAAIMDDVWNFIPARLTALLMVPAACIIGLDGKNAWRVYLRDRKKHASPNSGQTESVCAGALGVQLAGDTRYFGKMVKKPTIGNALRDIQPEDIIHVNRLMAVTSLIILTIISAAKLVVLYAVAGDMIWAI